MSGSAEDVDKQQDDIQAAAFFIESLSPGKVRTGLEEQLRRLSREVCSKVISLGGIPRHAVGVAELLNAAASSVGGVEDVVFLAVHFLFLQRGWKLQDSMQPSEQSSASRSDKGEGNFSQVEAEVPGLSLLLPDSWSAGRDGSCKVLYVDEKGKPIEVTSLKVGDRVMVHAVCTEDTGKTYSAELKIKDFISSTSGELSSSNRDENLTCIQGLNVCSVQIADSLLRASIFPDKGKERKRRTESSSASASRQKPSADRSSASSSEQDPPDKGNSSGIPAPGVTNRPRNLIPGQRDWGFDDDLNPFRGSGVGGNQIGPDHPGFGRIHQGGGRPGLPGVPPGARFDPFGPGVPGLGRGRGGGGPPFHPDLMPPGPGMGGGFGGSGEFGGGGGGFFA